MKLLNIFSRGLCEGTGLLVCFIRGYTSDVGIVGKALHFFGALHRRACRDRRNDARLHITRHRVHLLSLNLIPQLELLCIA